MKRNWLCALLSLVMCVVMLLPASALAAGKATVTKESFFVRPFLSYHAAEVYAEVTNTGDKPIVFNGGLIELFDAEGNSIESSNVYSCYPPILAPGEVGYIYDTISVDEATEKSFIDDYSLTVTSKGENEKTVTLISSEGSYGEVQRSKYSTDYAVVTAMVTNDTKELVQSLRVVFAVYNTADKLLYVTSVEPYNVGLPAGQTIQVQTYVDSRMVEAWAEESLTATSIVTIAYAEN